MYNPLKTSALAALVIVLLTGRLSAHTDVYDTLPDMGTTAGSTLSVAQEIQMGDFYLRQLRSMTPLIHDPLLNHYINQVGQKLVSHASSVRTPFNFWLIRNDELNAFAFFGGNVVLHSALFRYSDNESQLASVVAHEISHVTQRHLARAMEQQQRNAPLTWAGALGSALLVMANPQAGMAALTGTLAGARQGIISFTQSNEQEADRIGLQVLQRSGFNPQAMPDFLQKLADLTRSSSAPPEMLMTHPLPDKRLADARNRANQFPPVSSPSSADYYLAKARILGMYATGKNQLTDELLTKWRSGSIDEQKAAQYGRAILLMEEKNNTSAKGLITALLAKDPQNIWFLDLATDIDLALHQPQQAIDRLLAVAGNQSHPVLQLNLANAYLKAGKPALAGQILNRYTWQHRSDINGWDLLAEVSAARGLRDEELSARAEQLALNGKIDQAITTLSSASNLVDSGSLKQARYDARIDQLRQLRQIFQPYRKDR